LSATIELAQYTRNRCHPKSTTILNVGSTETLTEKVAPTNATNQNVNWTSNFTSVSTVDVYGKVQHYQTVLLQQFQPKIKTKQFSA